MMDAFEMLQELLAQGQFELILPEAFETAKLMDKLRLVYLMNDAAESFLVFHQVKITEAIKAIMRVNWTHPCRKMVTDMYYLSGRENVSSRSFLNNLN